MKLNQNNITKAVILLFAISTFLFASSSNGMIWDIASLSLVGYAGILVFRKKNIKKSGFLIWAIAILYCMFFSAIYSVDKSGAITTSINQLRLVIYSICFLYVIQSTENIKWAVLSFYIASLALSAQLLMNADWAYILTTSTRYANTLRVVLNENQHVNITAYNMVIGCLCGFLYYRIWGKGWNKLEHVLFWGSVMILMLGVFITGARKSIFALGVILIAQFWDKKRAWKIVTGVLLLYIVWLAILRIPALYQVLGNRVEGLFSGQMDASSTERINLMKEAFAAFTNSPIWGIGIDQLKYYTSEFRYAHNNFLEILADLGIIGFSVYYSLVARCSYRVFSMRIKDYKLKTTLCAVLISYFVLDIFQVSYPIMTNAFFVVMLSELILMKKGIIQ